MNKKALSERIPEHVFSKIHQAIAEASTYWTALDCAGAFEANRCSKIAFELCHFVADELDKVRTKEECLDDSSTGS